MSEQTAHDNQAAGATNATADDAGRNLIVNYLPPTIDEASLEALFNAYGEIESSRVIRDRQTQKSLGYGFVKYKTQEQADAAVAGLNGHQMENKTLKVSIARPSSAVDNKTNLYIAGLETHYTKDDLQTIFSPYGEVVEAKILLDKFTNTSRGVGFVRYATKREAEVAISALNGVKLAGTSKELTVRFAETKEKVRRGKPMPTMMASGASPYGTAMGYYGMMQQPAATSMYAGYQQMYDMSAAAPTMAPPMAPKQPAAPVAPDSTLFVYNLPPTSNENYLYHMFAPYGNVANVKVIRDMSTGLCKGYGFVNMCKPDECMTAIHALNGAMVGNKALQVSLKRD